jgi:hypothetical protein
LTYIGRVSVAVGLAIAVLFAVGCGETILDLSKAEDQIKASVEESPGDKVTSVDCPSDVEVEPQTKFTCTVRLAGGETKTATLLIRDEDANLDLLRLQPDK